MSLVSLALQAQRALVNIRSRNNDLDKHTYLTSLQERNERLFYRVLNDNIEELLPIIHMPTVAEYCSKYGLMFRSLPRGLWITIEDRGGGPSSPSASSWGVQPAAGAGEHVKSLRQVSLAAMH